MDFALRSCGLRGHATYAPTEPELRARLRVDTPVGEAWRCLRCETFVVGDPRGSGPADHAPEIPRGRLLRDRVIMRALAIERIFRGIVFTLLAWGVYKVRDAHDVLQRKFEHDLPLLGQLGIDLEHSKTIHFVSSAFSLKPATLMLIAIGLLAYAVVEFIEAVGLWMVKRWGEYFAVIATSAFLPLEIYELTEKVSAFKALAFVVNIAAVVWLVWSKRLFGINGGGKAYHAEHGEESLLTLERAAASRGH